MLRKTLCVFIMTVLFLGLSPQFSINVMTAPAVTTFSIINPGRDGYPNKWTAYNETIRDLGTPNFIFYQNETPVDSKFFMNITVTDVERMKGWGIGIIYDNTILNYASAWRPSDHVFSVPEFEFEWSIVAPAPQFEDVNATHRLMKWGCTYIMGDPSWCFNGTGTLGQIQFRMIKEVNATYPKAIAYFAFDPAWTNFYQHPTGTVSPQMALGYFEYVMFFGLTITSTLGGTTVPPPGTYTYAAEANVTVTAINSTGYIFHHWELNGIEIGSQNPINITMNAIYNLNAFFRALPLLKLEPPSYTCLREGDVFKINVTINNLDEAWHLVGVQIGLVYNTSIFKYLGWQSTTFIQSFVNGGESYIDFAFTDFHGDPLLPPCHNKVLIGEVIIANETGAWEEPFPSGSGVIAIIALNVTAKPPVSSNLILSETELLSDIHEFIPHRVQDCSFTFPYETRNLMIAETTGGTTNPEPGTYTYPLGTNATVTALPFNNYLFDHWELNGTDIGSKNPVNITMDADHVLLAVFSVINRALTITATAGGTTNPAPGTYTYTNGTEVSVTAIPLNNYMLDHWELDGANIGSDNPVTITMDADYALHAVFSIINRTLTITATTGGTTSPAPGTYTHTNGSVVQVTATPSNGYNFSNWILDGVNRTGTSITITMDADHILQAVFADKIKPEIGTPTQNPPTDNVQPGQQVTVRVNVTDYGSTVKNVTLLYRNDTTWYSVNMTRISGTATSGTWEANITGHALGTLIRYQVAAYDFAQNYALNDNATQYFVFTVIPELPPNTMLIIFMLVSTIVMLIALSKPRKTKRLN